MRQISFILCNNYLLSSAFLVALLYNSVDEVPFIIGGLKMKTLLVMDSKNYNDSMPHFLREAVRAIILSNKGIALVKSEKEGYYKFPGGGIENGETHVQTLKRETKEETGLNIIDSSIKAFGMVKEVKKVFLLMKYLNKIHIIIFAK